MTEPIYFQWQNEFLCKTIYPLREMKLRDFLVYYREFDLWAEYQPKSMEDLAEQVAAYRQAEAAAWAKSLAAYTTLRDYFFKTPVDPLLRPRFPQPDPNEMTRIENLHRTFATLFPKMNSVRRESQFISQRIYEWEQHRKVIVQQIADNQRKLRNMGPTWTHRPRYEAETATLQNVTMKMLDGEIDQLYAFLTAHGKLEKRRNELTKWRTDTQKQRSELMLKLQRLRSTTQPIETQLRTTQSELQRILHPPDYTSLETYLLTPDVTAALRARFPQVDSPLIARINDFHRSFLQTWRTTREPLGRLNAVKNQILRVQQARRSAESEIAEHERNIRNMGPTWRYRAERQAMADKLRQADLLIYDEELSRFQDFQSALTNQQKSPAELQQIAARLTQDSQRLEGQLSQYQSQVTDLEAQIRKQDEALNTPEEESLSNFSSTRPITKADIVNGLVDDYKASLMPLGQMQLLEAIVQRFIQQPERFPLWLQYMVIHFSGMRYQSAHGSWADPKDLLGNLRTSTIEKNFRSLADDAVDALCREKVALYEPAPGMVVDAGELPALAKTTKATWKAKITHHISKVKSPSSYVRRKALFDLLLDEENYEIETMSEEQALNALETYKSIVPDWMWKEIVKLTALRLREVKDPNWENLTPEQQEERDDRRWGGYRQMMNQWKQEHLTGWREEHDRANRLIVTRAVCNEVAEHIQHLRGLTPPGGLTSKPGWYMRDILPNKTTSGPRPFFVKPRTASDFAVGGSILWLRFVPDFPNPWRIAPPIRLKNGEGLLPDGIYSGEGVYRSVRDGWHYEQDPNGAWIKRSRSAQDAQGQSFHQEEWLRWMHEATVAEVAETADGPIVLTFETALPYEDKRTSTIGVFKHRLDYITYYVTGDVLNGSFVGFIPEGQIPADDLAEMLDWNKILLREVMTPDQLAAHQAKTIYRKA